MHSSPTPDPSLSHRRTQTTLTVLGPDGAPLADSEVTVAQRDHAFGFGNIGFDMVALANQDGSTNHGGANSNLELLAEQFVGLYNSATLPFYWGRFEPERGKPDTARMLKTAQWFKDRGIRTKGHPLVWHTVQPDWLLELPTAEIERLQRERIRRDVADFAGLIDTWDAINEVVIMPVFANGDNGITNLAREKGRIHMIRMAFEEAQATNPNVKLLLNDFDMSTAYECLIEGVLEAGIKVDVLGLQSHMHQGYWGEEKTLGILERFSRYGLPIHFTETTLLSGDIMPPEIKDLNDYQLESWPSTPEGEERQADEMVRHYRTLLSHPSVHSMTYWGLSDEGMWLGAPGGLIRADGTPKPSYDALRDLVKGEWWYAPTTLRSDAQGQVRVEGWLGDYDVTAGGTTATVTLDTIGAGTAQVQLSR